MYPQFSERMAEVDRMASGIGWGFGRAVLIAALATVNRQREFSVIAQIRRCQVRGLPTRVKQMLLARAKSGLEVCDPRLSKKTMRTIGGAIRPERRKSRPDPSSATSVFLHLNICKRHVTDC